MQATCKPHAGHLGRTGVHGSGEIVWQSFRAECATRLQECILALAQSYKYTVSEAERKHEQELLLTSSISMATTVPPQTWKNGYMAPSKTATWEVEDFNSTEDQRESHYETPPFKESLSSTVHNSLGLNVVRTWPTLFNGTESAHGIPDWWKPAGKVDVLICGGTRAVVIVLDIRKLRGIL